MPDNRERFLEALVRSTLVPLGIEEGSISRHQDHCRVVTVSDATTLGIDAVEKEEGVPVRVHLYRPDSERRTSWEALVANLPPLPAGLPEPRVVQNPGKKRVYLRFEWARLSVDYERDRVLVEAGARWLVRHARL